MLTISIKTDCVHVVINIKSIYLNKHLFFCVSLHLQRKTIIFYGEENVIESKIQKSLDRKKSIFR